MHDPSDIATNEALVDLDLPLPGRSEGKVRIRWDLPEERHLFVTTDRLSVFDRVVAAVPHKGEILNRLSLWWFENTGDIVANHVVGSFDPNVLVARRARPLPVEVVVRGYITGVTSTSLWRRYAAGERIVYGHVLPDGLRKNERLPAAIVTPTTKAAPGHHDEPLTCAEVTARGLVEESVWERVTEAALALFERGQKVAREAGLIMADTKYEFGLDPSGEVMLIDELHTPDSSRYWDEATFVDRWMGGHEPVSMDKEIVRRAYADAGYSGEGDPPALEPSVWAETSRRYAETFTAITGEDFVPAPSPARSRIMEALAAAGLITGGAR
jgi:phosphoribosylaminoimidazole-succinocarboxamide synthase